jgi:hypothetical protein
MNALEQAQLEQLPAVQAYRKGMAYQEAVDREAVRLQQAEPALTPQQAQERARRTCAAMALTQAEVLAAVRGRRVLEDAQRLTREEIERRLDRMAP